MYFILQKATLLIIDYHTMNQNYNIFLNITLFGHLWNDVTVDSQKVIDNHEKKRKRGLTVYVVVQPPRGELILDCQLDISSIQLLPHTI
jgi:hypothetical protein